MAKFCNIYAKTHVRAHLGPFRVLGVQLAIFTSVECLLSGVRNARQTTGDFLGKVRKLVTKELIDIVNVDTDGFARRGWGL